jgi:hypothetical protein
VQVQQFYLVQVNQLTPLLTTLTVHQQIHCNGEQVLSTQMLITMDTTMVSQLLQFVTEQQRLQDL